MMEKKKNSDKSILLKTTIIPSIKAFYGLVLRLGWLYLSLHSEIPFSHPWGLGSE